MPFFDLNKDGSTSVWEVVIMIAVILLVLWFVFQLFDTNASTCVNCCPVVP